MKFSVLWTILGLLSLSRADAPISPQLIAQLVNEAAQHHPAVAAAQARTEAAQAAIQAVRLWSDPQLGLGLNLARRSMRQNDGDLRLGLEQMLPQPQLYAAEQRQADASLATEQAKAQQITNELGLSIAHGVVELALADEVIRLQAENLSWLQTIVSAAAERAKNPGATAAETLRLESELALRTQALTNARNQRSQMARALNLLLGRPATAAWSALLLPVQTPLPQTLDALQKQMQQTNPQLAGLRHQSTGAKAETDMAVAKQRPVLSLAVETDTYSGGKVVDTMIGLKVNLPWLNRSAYAADVSRSQQLQAASEKDLAAAQLTLTTQLTSLLTELENQRQAVQAYTTAVIPKSQQALETIQNAWVSSQATLLEVLDAQRTLLESRQEAIRARAAAEAARQSLISLTTGFK